MVEKKYDGLFVEKYFLYRAYGFDHQTAIEKAKCFLREHHLI